MSKIPEAVAKVLAAFTEVYPQFNVSPLGAKVWSAALAPYRPDELEAAVVSVVRHWAYGAPTIHAVILAIEGRVEERRYAKTDAFGNALPGQYEWREVVMGIDGRQREARPGLPEGDRAALPESVQELIAGIAQDPNE